MRTNISKTSMELIQSPPKNTFYVINTQDTLDQLYRSFSDINAHKDLQKPNFAMPELLIKELYP